MDETQCYTPGQRVRIEEEEDPPVHVGKMAIIESALAKFYMDCERFPDDSEGLGVLLEAPEGLEEKWKGRYVKESEILDPWGNPYIYVAEGMVNIGSFDLISYGPDGMEGGEGDNEDIIND